MDLVTDNKVKTASSTTGTETSAEQTKTDSTPLETSKIQNQGIDDSVLKTLASAFADQDDLFADDLTSNQSSQLETDHANSEISHHSIDCDEHESNEETPIPTSLYSLAYKMAGGIGTIAFGNKEDAQKALSSGEECINSLCHSVIEVTGQCLGCSEQTIETVSSYVSEGVSATFGALGYVVNYAKDSFNFFDSPSEDNRDKFVFEDIDNKQTYQTNSATEYTDSSYNKRPDTYEEQASVRLRLLKKDEENLYQGFSDLAESIARSAKEEKEELKQELEERDASYREQQVDRVQAALPDEADGANVLESYKQQRGPFKASDSELIEQALRESE